MSASIDSASIAPAAVAASSIAAAAISAAQARAQSIGYLALACAGKRLPLDVHHSAAGHYIGTADIEGPVSRESSEFFRSHTAAARALSTGRWQQLLKY